MKIVIALAVFLTAAAATRASAATCESLAGVALKAGTINRAEVEDYQSKYEVISTRLVAGNSVIHVLSDKKPAGFEPVEGGLEDVYFSTLSTLRRAA